MTGQPTENTTLDIHQIMDSIPHRYPFLLVDRIVEFTDDGIVGLKNVTINEPHFQGHWPNEPVMPGVLQLEALAQAGAVMLFNRILENAGEQNVFFRSIDKAVFRRVVKPGDQLMLHVRLLKSRRGIYVMAGEAKVDGETASEAQMTAVVMPKNATADHS